MAKKDKLYSHEQKRFLSHVIKVNDCWIWRSNSNETPPRFWDEHTNNTVLAARKAIQLFSDKTIPKKRKIRWSCENKRCVNPSHISFEKTCSFVGCTKKHRAMGFCNTHFSQFKHGHRDLATLRTQKQELYDQGMLDCAQCKESKPIERFCNSKNGWFGKFSICKDCQRQSRIDDFDKNKNKYLLINFNISLDQYNDRLQKQNGVCAICRKEDFKSLAVDHNHQTEVIRGLLCSRCNTTLGKVEESIDLLNEMIFYLSNNGSRREYEFPCSGK